VAINNRHDFHALPAFRCPNLCPATLGHHERRVDEAFFFIQRTSLAKLVCKHPSAAAAKTHRGTKPETADVPFCSWDSFAAAYAITHLFEKPQDCFKNATCRDRLASGTTILLVFG
jgi:hypothetical protein